MTNDVSSVSAVEEFNREFARYLVWSKKEQGAAIEDRGRKVRFALYREFRAIAKSAGAIRAEAAALGYAIKRRERSARDQQDLRSAYGLRGELSHADSHLTIEEEIKARGKSVKFLSVSFLFRAWKTAKEGQRGTFSAFARGAKQIGAAVVRTEKGNEAPFVSLTSLLQGAVEQNQRRAIADRALRAQAQDMADYIARKHQAYLQATFEKTYSVALNGGAA